MHPTSIGPFRIQRELGRGGMGVVYLARDTKLDRLVAVKSLPAHLADDSDRLARFQREAKVLASLNHPGIAAIYGFEEAGKHQYLILEYVEGETLDTHLKKRAIPIEEALSLAKQIAEALEAAHEKGVIHRDLKPLNVIVTPDSVVKVLDFGLARTEDGVAAFPHFPDSPDSPTLTLPTPIHSPTVSGMIMGTAGYMSPEQARGKALDKRSDIFSFGCILYELLSRERPFRGETVADMIAATLHTELNFDSLPPTIPPRVRDLLVSCLSKDRKQRLHDIGDARLVLDRAIQGREWAAAPKGLTLASQSNPIHRALPWTLAALFLVVSAVSLWKLWKRPQQGHIGAAGVIKLRVDDAEAPPFSVYDMGNLAISDDGQQVAYITQTGEEPSLVLRRMDDASIQRLAPANIEAGPQFYGPSADLTFSRDGRLIAAFGASSVYLVPVSGGEPTLLHRGPRNVATKGGAWTTDGFIYCPAPNAGLVFIPVKGGEPQTLTVPDPARDELSHRWPDVLPGGRQALITVKKAGILSFDDAEVALLDLNTKTWKTVLSGGSYARYVPTGHIVFARNGSIMAVPFDVQDGTVTGTSVAIVVGVTTSPGSGVAQFAVARDSGTLVYMPGGPIENRRELIWIDTEGKVEPVGAPIMPYRNAACSADGIRIATNVFGASDAVFVFDLIRRTNTRITFRGNCGGAVWMAGTRIAYATDADGPTVTNVVNADGSGEPEKIADFGFNEFTCLVTTDGKLGVLYAERGDIWRQLFPSEPRQKLLGSQFDETEPHVSPDGKWLSYASNESGQYEVYVRPYPLTDARWQVSIGGGRLHCWAPDGDAIYYLRDAEKSFLRVPFQTPNVEIGQPALLFNMPMDAGAFQAHPSGKKFLAIRDLPPKFNSEQIYVVLNWFDELKAKVPTGQN